MIFFQIKSLSVLGGGEVGISRIFSLILEQTGNGSLLLYGTEPLGINLCKTVSPLLLVRNRTAHFRYRDTNFSSTIRFVP